MKIKEVLDKTNKFFAEKGFDSPRLEAELLLAHALKLERIQLYLKFEQPMSEAEVSLARDFVRRRVQGEPVAYIVGEKAFFTSTFRVGPGVLIPRPETEHLVEEAIEWIKKNPRDEYAVVDLGCGTGCIGLSVLKAEACAHLFAVDISEKALSYAKENAERLGLTERCTFILADASDAEQILTEMKHKGFSKIDLLLSNPPYIGRDDKEVQDTVRAFEPHEALFAERQGLEKLQSWSKLYRPFLTVPGLMLMEMGYRQGPQMKQHFEDLKINSVAIKKDLAGHDRVIRGETL